MNERNSVVRDARTLGIPKMLLLVLQHIYDMFVATILVPILVNPILSPLHEAQSSCISWIILRVPRRIPGSCQSGYRHFREYDNG